MRFGALEHLLRIRRAHAATPAGNLQPGDANVLLTVGAAGVLTAGNGQLAASAPIVVGATAVPHHTVRDTASVSIALTVAANGTVSGIVSGAASVSISVGATATGRMAQQATASVSIALSVAGDLAPATNRASVSISISATAAPTLRIPGSASVSIDILALATGSGGTVVPGAKWNPVHPQLYQTQFMQGKDTEEWVDVNTEDMVDQTVTNWKQVA